MDLSIIIVNWNSREYLRRCLASLFSHTSGVDFEVLVIDSGSFDGSDGMLRQHFPQVRFIQSAENLGFAKANNRAFLVSRGNSVLFLNPDTELVSPAIALLFSKLNSLEQCGVVGGKLLNADGTIQSSSVQAMPTILNKVLDSDILKTLWPRCSLWGMAPLYDNRQRVREVAAVSGACMMLKRRVFEHVQLFSEDYFMYAEDVDLCHKVRMAGYVNYYVPQASLIHHGGRSSKDAANTFTAVMMPEASLRFLRKTRGHGYASAYRVAMFASAVGRLTALAAAIVLSGRSRSQDSLRAAFRKWLAVLRWSLKREDITKTYYQR